MKGTTQKLESRDQTGSLIYEGAEYYQDLGKYLDTSLKDFFNFVSSIPYLEDDGKTEIVSRPLYLIHKKFNLKGLDCKKKAVLMGAWFNAHGTPWRLVAVSERPDKEIHHVFVQAYLGGKWMNIDPTYPEFKLFESKPEVTYGEVLLK